MKYTLYFSPDERPLSPTPDSEPIAPDELAQVFETSDIADMCAHIREYGRAWRHLYSVQSSGPTGTIVGVQTADRFLAYHGAGT